MKQSQQPLSGLRTTTLKPFERLGPVSLRLCHLYGGIVIGGAATVLAQGLSEPFRDVDIVIPAHRWVDACKLIPEGALANKYGGFVFRDGDVDVDVWAGCAATTVLESPFRDRAPYLWSPRFSGSLVWHNAE